MIYPILINNTKGGVPMLTTLISAYIVANAFLIIATIIRYFVLKEENKILNNSMFKSIFLETAEDDNWPHTFTIGLLLYNWIVVFAVLVGLVEKLLN